MNQVLAKKHIETQAFHLLIGGRLTPGATTMEVINPATGKVLATCPRADAKQLDAAVQAAKAAFPAWARLGIEARRAKLLRIADALEARLQEFAELVTAEQGKTITEANGEMAGSVMMIRLLAALDLPSRVLKEDAREKIVEHRTPLGVVAAITPWNFPMILLAIKVTPALLAGNTVVSKPAPTTPLSSLRFVELCNEHLPPGVLNIITDQNDLGGLLTRHPDIAKVSFTGSTVTGKKVMESAASSLKRITLELGGNDAAIVLDDADIKSVAPRIFAYATGNAGQICLAIKRVYVHESQYDAMCEELAALARSAVVGDGMEPGTQIGPLQNRMQYEKVKALIADARRDGKIIAGGEIPDRPGYFIPPTVVRDIPDDARLVREEQFGPVIPVLKYRSIDEAVARVNDTTYGLGGSVWSSDPERAYQVALRIDSGTVWVNAHLNCYPDVPAGGAKQSGIGAELGLEGLEEYTQNHVVYLTKSA
jgi:acyl-CoA reductase-like NAD-dependent aldehyde dehydrogenase